MEYMLGVALPASGSCEVHASGLRETRDFDDRDRSVLALLAPHLAAVHRNAQTIGELETDLATLRQGLEANGRTAILLGPGRRIRHMSARARHLLTAYFGARWIDRSALPAPIDDWLRRQGLTADASVAPLRPLVVEHDGRRLTIQLLRSHGGPFLLLSERKLRIAPADIASLGLSPRETEVLAWLAHGKSNAEIAGILGLSPATIKHCLERVYGKLDVGTRAAATAVAVAAAGIHG
jgi:DNA-binding CsgD family transcriptional regulator